MRSLVVVANRLPVTVSLDASDGAGGVELYPSSGGLVTALSSLETDSRLWIGWPGTEVPDRLQAPVRSQLLEAHGAVPVFLTADQVDRYYNSFSNGVIWPLFHYLTDLTNFQLEGWNVYREVNEIFAEQVAEYVEDDTLVWIHDYQLMLVPAMLRRLRPKARIGVFLHIPFPSSEVYRLLPVREEILEGLLGADLIGFHTYGYLRHFASSCTRVLGLDAQPDAVHARGRRVRLSVDPVGIDTAAFREQSQAPETRAELAALRERFTGIRLILGVDRMDYSKGLRHKMRSFERFLERDPDHAEKVQLLQVAVPSRTEILDYQKLRSEIESLVGRINGLHGGLGHTPVEFHYRSITPAELSALYQLADVCWVSPVRDGMNLVCQEYVASRLDDDGVLVLSEFAGAATQLDGAVMVNPWHEEQMAESIEQALAMPREERRDRMVRMKRSIAPHTVSAWARGFVSKLEQSQGLDPTWESRRLDRDLDSMLEAFGQARHRYLLLDYDGTLRPFTPTPDAASPTPELLDLLGGVAAIPRTHVYIVSGRPTRTLEEWLGHLPISLCAEHGLFICEKGSERWESVVDITTDWMEVVHGIMEGFAARTPGSLVEAKSGALAWHWRRSDPDYGQWQANELAIHLSTALANLPVEVIHGNKVIEVRAQGVHKGALPQYLSSRWSHDDFALAIGDDETDEDLFAHMPSFAWTARVGKVSASARYLIETQADVLRLLQKLVDRFAGDRADAALGS